MNFALSPVVREALLSGDIVTDTEIDQALPMNYERLSDVQWSSVRVARVIARYLKGRPEASFLDLGCGVGKLCLILALTTDLQVSGVERRPALISVCRRLASANEARINFIHSDMFKLDWTEFDVLYLYNPFMEHKCSRSSRNLIDGNIDLSRSTYEDYVNQCFVRLANLKPSQLVITYHGFGGSMPDTLKLITSERVGTGTVRLWGHGVGVSG